MYYHQILIATISSNNSLYNTNEIKLINNPKNEKYYKLLDILFTKFIYSYLVLISNFHKTQIKFRSVTIRCNKNTNKANTCLLKILN